MKGKKCRGTKTQTKECLSTPEEECATCKTPACEDHVAKCWSCKLPQCSKCIARCRHCALWLCPGCLEQSIRKCACGRKCNSKTCEHGGAKCQCGNFFAKACAGELLQLCLPGCDLSCEKCRCACVQEGQKYECRHCKAHCIESRYFAHQQRPPCVVVEPWTGPIMSVSTFKTFKSRTMGQGSYPYKEAFLGGPVDKPVQVAAIADDVNKFICYHNIRAYVPLEALMARIPVVEDANVDAKALEQRLSEMSVSNTSPREVLSRQLRKFIESQADSFDASSVKELFLSQDTPVQLKEQFYELVPGHAIRFDTDWEGHSDVAMSKADAKSKPNSSRCRPNLSLTKETEPTSCKMVLHGVWLKISIPARVASKFVIDQEGSIVKGIHDQRHVIFMPSFRRSQRARCHLDMHEGFDVSCDLVILVVRDYDFDSYVKTAGKACVVIALPPFCIGMGYARHVCVQIGFEWKLPHLFMLDDDVKSINGNVSLADVFDQLLAFMKSNPKSVLVGGTKSHFPESKDPRDQTPQVLVLVNLELLLRANLNYDYRLCYAEDFVLGLQAKQRGLSVHVFPQFRVHGDMKHDHGGFGSPASGTPTKKK